LIGDREQGFEPGWPLGSLAAVQRAVEFLEFENAVVGLVNDFTDVVNFQVVAPAEAFDGKFVADFDALKGLPCSLGRGLLVVLFPANFPEIAVGELLSLALLAPGGAAGPVVYRSGGGRFPGVPRNFGSPEKFVLRVV
jgi:hypothetical protein